MALVQHRTLAKLLDHRSPPTIVHTAAAASKQSEVACQRRLVMLPQNFVTLDFQLAHTTPLVAVVVLANDATQLTMIQLHIAVVVVHKLYLVYMRSAVELA